MSTLRVLVLVLRLDSSVATAAQGARPILGADMDRPEAKLDASATASNTATTVDGVFRLDGGDECTSKPMGWGSRVSICRLSRAHARRMQVARHQHSRARVRPRPPPVLGRRLNALSALPASWGHGDCACARAGFRPRSLVGVRSWRAMRHERAGAV